MTKLAYQSRPLDIVEHRNACVFYGLSPCLNEAIKRTEEERDLWVLGGATNLDLLTAPIPGL
jgi:hypothetical protein